MNEYRSFQEYDRDLKLFFNYFMENGPKTVNKQMIILDFLEKAAVEGGSHFYHTMKMENEMVKQVIDENKVRYDT